MQKNVAGQKWIVYAYEDEGGSNPGEPVTGDAGNITANLRIDAGAANAVDDTNPTELEDGFYSFDITAAESNGESIVICPASSTANVNVVGAPAAVWTTPANFPDFSIAATNGRVDVASVAGTAQTANDNGADINAILVDTNALNDTKIPDTISLANINTQVDTALSDINLDHLLSASASGTDVADDSVMAQLVSASGTADWDDFVNTTDSLQALRDRGDSAWTTGGGGSISDIISWHPLIPQAIDLANTKSYRLGIATTNMLDDLPTAAEITPGTISIDRAAQGGTSWSAVVTDAAMSESDGIIYYDEVFDTATGYASGDVLRVTLKGQLVTVSANDYELTPSGGQIYYTGIIADTPDVNIAQISGSSTAADVLELFALALNQGTGQLDSGSLTAGTLTAAAIQDGAFTTSKFGTVPANVTQWEGSAVATPTVAGVPEVDITHLAGSVQDVATETTAAAILLDTGTTLPSTLSDIETDTQNIQSRLPASLNNGVMPADMQRINDYAVTGDGSGTPFTI